MLFGATSQVTLVIQGTAGEPINFDVDFGGGMSAFMAIIPLNKVVARLMGSVSDVAISLRDADEPRAISTVLPTKWIWDVEPKVLHPVSLSLQVDTLVRVDQVQLVSLGDPLPPFIVPVTSSLWDHVKVFTADVGPVLTVLGTILTGVLAAIRFGLYIREKRATAQLTQLD